MKKLSIRKSDAFLALFVVAVAAMLLMPLPTPLLDFLLVVNISFSLLLLLVGLYMPNALTLLAFPALLLLSTLFRLSLNVASTRLILSNGDAGQVISAFGGFLIAGNAVVGAVVFSIITVVNFIVIARGATRVSEVSARFALDSLPGKQMAIDADMRAGIISAEEARHRRDDLRKESQLYGAMDGAMRFVQGDAIAGLFIIAINIFGGLYLGIINGGMGFQEAVETYTMLTVGDGLVSQIPSLLISICAGIIVTRVSSGENTTLGTDLAAQLFKNSVLLYAAGILACLIGCIPSIPSWPFFVVALLLFRIAYKIQGKTQTSSSQSHREGKGGSSTGENESELKDPVVVHISQGLNHLYQLEEQNFHSWWYGLQQDFYEATGLMLPTVRIESDTLLPASNFCVSYRDVPLFSGEVPVDAIFVEMNPESAKALGCDIIAKELHPISGELVAWCVRNRFIQKLVEAADVSTYDPLEYIGLKTAVFFQQHPEEILSMFDVHSKLKDIQQKHPGLIAETFNSEFINVSRITKILNELVKEGISVKNFEHILESTAAYCSAYGASMVQQDDFDVQDIVSFIRVECKRQLTASQLSERNSLRVLTMSSELKDLLDHVTVDIHGNNLEIDDKMYNVLRRGILQIIEPIAARGVLPVSILCPFQYRDKIGKFLRSAKLSIGLITFEELDPALPVEKIGIWQV